MYRLHDKAHLPHCLVNLAPPKICPPPRAKFTRKYAPPRAESQLVLFRFSDFRTVMCEHIHKMLGGGKFPKRGPNFLGNLPPGAKFT